MTLISSKRKPSYRWQNGDFISAAEASGLLGYKSPKQFQDEERLQTIAKRFEEAGCQLTTNLWIGSQRRFLRTEIDAYLTRLVENARHIADKRKKDLGVLR